MVPTGALGTTTSMLSTHPVALSESPNEVRSSQTISAIGVNITSANIRTTKDQKAIALFDLEVSDLGQLQKVTQALEAKKGVIAVERVRS